MHPLKLAKILISVQTDSIPHDVFYHLFLQFGFTTLIKELFLMGILPRLHKWVCSAKQRGC